MDHICIHAKLPRVDVVTSEHFQMRDAIGCTDEVIEEGFALAMRRTFTNDSYSPYWESLEAIETLSLYYDWAIGTARAVSGSGTTSRWASRVYMPRGATSQTHYAQGQGNLFGHLRSGETKLELCKRLKALAIVEDNPHEIRHFVEYGAVTEPICIAFPYNESIAHEFPSVMRGSWPQITQYLLARLG